MKRYTAAQARQQLAELLDLAERGQAVVIERRGVRFGVRMERRRRPQRKRAALIDLVDPAVQDGSWTWEWQDGELAFAPKKRRR
jgi:antitoxin (DNA-binding transcriptional repressor) of toxin-antitoxin stability system